MSRSIPRAIPHPRLPSQRLHRLDHALFWHRVRVRHDTAIVAVSRTMHADSAVVLIHSPVSALA
jgi:hypothetical protein